MWYIVYDKSLSGYYSGHKESYNLKGDYYSPNWFEAVKYTSLGAAITEPIDVIFSMGHIDRIGENGELLGRADEEVMKYITDKITKNKAKSDKLWIKIDKITGEKSSYINRNKRR